MMNDDALTPEVIESVRAEVRAAIDAAIPNYVAQALQTRGITASQNAVTQLLSTITYPTKLGDYILDQNPYSARTDITEPVLPTGPGGVISATAEVPPNGICNPNLQPPPDTIKAGVLKTRHSGNTLPVSEPVPFGTMLPFGIITGPNDMYMYQHNIVKMLSLRYALKNRPKPNPDTTPGQPPTVPSNAYLIVCYSGGDSG